jgi:hypothetical protein
LEVLPICLRREVKTFIIWFYLPWFYYDVSLHKVVELVVAISMSPRSSKMESGCSSYCRFRFAISTVSGGKIAGRGPEIDGQEAGFSQNSEWLPLCFSLDFCLAFCSKIAGLISFSRC